MGGRDAMNAEQRELWERIEKVRPAMMTTAESDGSFRSRPMWTQGDEFQGILWFFVSDDGPLARELERNPRVGLSYAAPDEDLYVSVSGRAALVHDRGKADELWNTFAQAWFPGGVDDPHLGLLRVDVEQAQYWEEQEAQGAAVRGDTRRRGHGPPAEERRREEARIRTLVRRA